MKKLLVINFGGIGDEILFLPTLTSIRKNHPDWHITLMLEPRSRSVEQITDLIDQTVTFDIKKRPLTGGDLLDLVGMIRNGGYNCVVSSGGSYMVSALLFLSGVPRRIGYSRSSVAKFLLTDPVPLNKRQYAGDMYHDLVRGLAIADAAPPVRVSVSAESRERMKEILAEYPGAQHKILIHPGTSKLALEKGINKTWPAESWAELIKMLAGLPGTGVILAGGPDDEKTISQILAAVQPGLEQSCTAGSYFRSAYGKTRSLSDLAALIELSDQVICVDSAPMHVAVGLQKPLVALFGPTSERHLLPEQSQFVSLRTEDVSSDPFEAPLALPRGAGLSISPEQVFEAVGRQMERLQATPLAGGHVA